MVAMGQANQFRPLSFLRRQVSGEMTEPRRAFDLVFGVVMPLLCLCFDPFVFPSDSTFGTGLLSSYRAPAYFIITLLVLCLSWQLFSGGQVGTATASALLLGVFAAGALFAFLLGCILLPFSLLGMLVAGMGLLGLIPFVTSLVYARNMLLAWRGGERHGPGRVFATALVGATLAIGLPVLMHLRATGHIESSVDAICSDEDVEAAIEHLSNLGLWGNLDQVVWAWGSERDPLRSERLAAAYWRITDMDIRHRLGVLRD